MALGLAVVALAMGGCGSSDSADSGSADATSTVATGSGGLEECLADAGVGQTYTAHNFDQTNFDVSVFNDSGDVAILYGTDSPAAAKDFEHGLSIDPAKYPERGVRGSFVYLFGPAAGEAEKSAINGCLDGA
jgi:hypothetical protein